MGIPDAARAVISARFYGVSLAAFTAIGMGTGVTAFAVSNTALGTEVKADGTAAAGVHVLPAASVTPSSVTTTVTNDTAQWTGTAAIAITGTIAVTESGVFNADTNGVMLCRQTFSPLNVAAGDTLNFIWKAKNA